MKGLELPINMIIVIAIAVLVLVVVSAFFAGQTGSGFGTINLEAAFASACQSWRSSYDCSASGISAITTSYKFPGDTNFASFGEVCAFKTTGVKTGSPDTGACQRACGCPNAPPAGA